MITLYKGDDTAGQLGKKCIIKFHCDDVVDMTNVTVRFNLLGIVTKDFQNVSDGDELEVFVSHVDSRKLPLGIVYGKLWGEDSSGKLRTFANRIPFKLTTDLRCVYGSDGLDSVDVHVYASVEWGAVANKPTLFPSKVEMVEGLEEALKQAGKVTSVNNKTGDVELTAQDIPYGGEGASNVKSAIEQNAQAIGEKLSADDVVPETIEDGVKIVTIGGKEIKAPNGGGSANPPMYLHYRKVNGVAGLYTRKMVGGTAVYTLETFASISSQINGRVVECWLAYDDDPSHFEPEEETDRYSRFKLTTAATNLLTFDITGQYAGRMYSRRIKIDNNNVVELGARFEVQNAATALTKTDKTVLKSYLAKSVQDSLDKADSAYQKPSAGIPLSDIKASVFPPESHSHAQSEVEGLEAALGGKLDKSGGTMTGNLTLDNCALVLGDRYLAAYTPGVGFYSYDSGFILVPKTNKASDILALLSQLGFTSQDITDFLHYKGEVDGGVDVGEHQKGDVWYVKSNDTHNVKIGYWRCVDVSSGFPGDGNWRFIYAKNEGKTGLERLTDLFGESNSQLVSTIEAKAAYEIVTVGEDGVLTDRAINSTESATFVMPKDFTDLIVRFNGTPVSIDWATKETGITDVRGDDLPSESGDYLITFTRTKAAEAFVKVLNIAKE